MIKRNQNCSWKKLSVGKFVGECQSKRKEKTIHVKRMKRNEDTDKFSIILCQFITLRVALIYLFFSPTTNEEPQLKTTHTQPH